MCVFYSHPLRVQLNEFGSLSPERVFLIVESGSEAWRVVVGEILPVSWVKIVNFLDWAGWSSTITLGATFFLLFTFFLGWSWVLMKLGGELFLFLFFALFLLWWVEIALLGFWIWLLDWSGLELGLSVLLSLFWWSLVLLDFLLDLLWSWVWCFWFLWWTGCWWRWDVGALWSLLSSPDGSWVDHLVNFDPDIWSDLLVGDVTSFSLMLSHGWWEGLWTSTVVIIRIVISSGCWKDIDLIGSEPVDVWLHAWLGNILLGDVVLSGIEGSWEGRWTRSVVGVWLVVSSGSRKNIDGVTGETMNFLIHVWLSNIFLSLLLVDESLWWESKRSRSIISVWVVVSSGGWENIDVVTGETVDFLVHLWLSDILLTSSSLKERWWESLRTSSVVVIRIIISSSGWEDINLIGGEPVDVWLHTWLGNILLALTSLEERWWESLRTGAVVVIRIVISSSGWKNIDLIGGEPMDIWLHSWFGNIFLTLMDESLWWESFWSSSVVIVLLVISSSGWKDIDLVAGEPMDVWLHAWFGDVVLALTSSNEGWWESLRTGSIISVLFIISSSSWENVNVIGSETVNLLVHLWLGNIPSGFLSVPLSLGGSVVL